MSVGCNGGTHHFLVRQPSVLLARGGSSTLAGKKHLALSWTTPNMMLRHTYTGDDSSGVATAVQEIRAFVQKIRALLMTIRAFVWRARAHLRGMAFLCLI